MAVVSVPKDLDRVKKSLVWFWTVHGLSCGLCDVVLLPWVNNMLIMVFVGCSKMNGRIDYWPM